MGRASRIARRSASPPDGLCVVRRSLAVKYACPQVRVSVVRMPPSEPPQTPRMTTAAEDRAAAPHDLKHALARAQDEWRRRLSLHWRIFAVNAVVLVAAALMLALAPVTIHAPIRLYELAIVICGLIVMLIADIALVRRMVEPLRRLARLMTVVDP